ARARIGIVDALVVGEDHRYQARIDAPCTVFCPRRGGSPGPGRAIWPGIMPSAIRQRAVSGPWVCREMPMPHRIMGLLGFPNSRATSLMVLAGIPQTGAIASGL